MPFKIRQGRPFLGLAVLGPEMGPDRPNFKSYFVLDQNFAMATRPGPFRPKFALPAKRATGQKYEFCLRWL